MQLSELHTTLPYVQLPVKLSICIFVFTLFQYFLHPSSVNCLSFYINTMFIFLSLEFVFVNLILFDLTRAHR